MISGAATLEAFIAAVESGAHAKAIEDFYTENASMRENQAEPRRGPRELLIMSPREGSWKRSEGNTLGLSEVR